MDAAHGNAASRVRNWCAVFATFCFNERSCGFSQNRVSIAVRDWISILMLAFFLLERNQSRYPR